MKKEETRESGVGSAVETEDLLGAEDFPDRWVTGKRDKKVSRVISVFFWLPMKN